MSLLADRGSVTEYILITILIGISVLFVAQRYGITLRDKATDAGARIDGTGAADLEDPHGDSFATTNGMTEGRSSGSVASTNRGGSGVGSDGSAAATSGGTAQSSGTSDGTSGANAGSEASSATAASGAPGSAAATSADLTVEETGTLPASDEGDGAVDVLGFRITLSTAIWMALLLVAVGFVMIRQVSEKQKKVAKQSAAAARLRKGRT